MARKTWRSGPGVGPSSWGHARWGSEDLLGVEQGRARYRAAMERMKASARDASKERSFLCPGFRVPPYISWKLPRAARLELSRNVIGPSGRIDTDLDRPLRLFFETGLELRILPGPFLEIRAVYHVHPWIAGRRPAWKSGRLPLRGPFESTEELLGFEMLSWEKITDPMLSAHARLAGFSRRRNATDKLSCAQHVDATLTHDLWIVTPETTIRITRPRHTGLGWRCMPHGRDRFDPRDPLLASTQADTTRLNRALRDATAWVDGCLAAMPTSRRFALEAAAHISLVGCAFAELLRPARRLCLRIAESAGAHFRARVAPRTPGKDPLPSRPNKDQT